MITRLHENERMTQIVTFGPVIETAGQVAADPTQGIQGQAAQVFAALEQLLAQAGASKADLTRVQIWLANMADFDAMNAVYTQWLEDSPKPVRACVGAELVAGGYLIEVQAFAYRQS